MRNKPVRATSTDGAGVATVYLTATAKLGFLPRRHDGWDMWHHFSTMPARQETWIMRANGRVAAFLAVSQDWVDHLYVHPAAQNEGLGTSLLNQAKHVLPRGFQLWTFQQNPGAQRFYDRHGLEIAERTDGKRNEEGLPDLKFVWRPAKNP